MQKHPLWDLSGLNVEIKDNFIILPTVDGSKIYKTRRTIHQGRHEGAVESYLRDRMQTIVEEGKIKSFTQEQYREKLLSLMLEERTELQHGYRMLNKNHQPQSIPLPGQKTKGAN